MRKKLYLKQKNLAAEMPEKVQTMQKLLMKYFKETGACISRPVHKSDVFETRASQSAGHGAKPPSHKAQMSLRTPTEVIQPALPAGDFLCSSYFDEPGGRWIDLECNV